MTDRRDAVEVDVAAVIAEELAWHAPGTAVAGPESGGVQVIRVSLDVVTFRELLSALAAALGEGSHLRLDVLGGLLHLDVSGGRADADLGAIRELAQAMGGHLVPYSAAAEGFSVRVPTGLSEWA